MTKNGTLFKWVVLIGSPGSPSEAEEFIFNVEYKGPKCTHAFFGEVSSRYETFNDIVSGGKCSTINFRSLQNSISLRDGPFKCQGIPFPCNLDLQ